MPRVTLVSPLLDQLRRLTSRTELCDADGRRIGFFDPDEEAAGERTAVVPLTDEEIRLAEQQTAGRPLEEILAELERRPCG
jgi:hypothetical protein